MPRSRFGEYVSSLEVYGMAVKKKEVTAKIEKKVSGKR
jgi:hypothetical protein